MQLDIASAAERPDRRPLGAGLAGLWPRFMTQDETGDLFYGYEFDHYPEYQLIRQSTHDRLRGATPTIVSALEIMVRPDLRSRGLSARMLAALRANTAARGFGDMIAPVRPTGAQGRPLDRYAFEQRPDGLPVPQALAPVYCDVDANRAVYVEPNVWVHHRI